MLIHRFKKVLVLALYIHASHLLPDASWFFLASQQDLKNNAVQNLKTFYTYQDQWHSIYKITQDPTTLLGTGETTYPRCLYPIVAEKQATGSTAPHRWPRG